MFLRTWSLILFDIGDILAIGPSALAVFRHFPSLLQEYYDVGLNCENTVHHIDGNIAVPAMEFEYNRPDVAPHAAFPIRSKTIIGRYDLTNILYKQCVRLDIPIRWNVPIASYEEDDVSKKGRAIATDGTVYEADLVLAADGLGSRSHALTLGKPVRAVSTGYSIYRAAMWTRDLANAPLIEQYLKEQTRPQCRVYAGHNQHIVLVVSKRLISIAITLPNVRFHYKASYIGRMMSRELTQRYDSRISKGKLSNHGPPRSPTTN